MKRLSFPKMAISLPLAIIAAIALFLVNEASYHQSTAAVAGFAEVQRTRESVNKLLQNMLNAETGQRGYLLTADQRYLEPYNSATADLGQNLEQLRGLVAPYPADLAEFAILARHVTEKYRVMDLSVRLRREGSDEAWRLLLATDVGKEHMEVIRSQSERLLTSSVVKERKAHEKIKNSLLLSHIGIAATALGALIAFYLYLIQTRALLIAGTKAQHSLQRERDLLEKQVRERTATLAQLATHLQKVREDERGHLARELHDELGALLTAAKLDVARLKSRLGSSLPEATERLEHLTSTLNSGISLKRRIVEDLHPSSLSHLGLVASLEILAREFAERSGLNITTALENVTLNGSEQLTVYRLVQESLTNIGKYADANNAEISLKNRGDQMIITVKDDGKGFDPWQVASTTHGLTGMRHRVEAAGGRLTVDSREGQGTCIHAVLPQLLNPLSPVLPSPATAPVGHCNKL